MVLIAPEKRVTGDSRLATDNAMSWLVKPEQFEDMARLLRLTGFNWVRERLAWGEIEAQRGQFNGGKYDKAIDALDEACAHTQAVANYPPRAEQLIRERVQRMRESATSHRQREDKARRAPDGADLQDGAWDQMRTDGMSAREESCCA